MAIDVVDALRARFAEAGEAPALAYRGEVKSFNWLSSEIEEATTWLTENGIKQGQTVLLTSDYTPKTVAILFGLIWLRTIIVPLLPTTKNTLINVLPSR